MTREITYPTPEEMDPISALFFEKHRELLPFLEKLGVNFDIKSDGNKNFYLFCEEFGELNLEDPNTVLMLKASGKLN